MRHKLLSNSLRLVLWGSALLSPALDATPPGATNCPQAVRQCAAGDGSRPAVRGGRPRIAVAKHDTDH
jgi:hypothetical protein